MANGPKRQTRPRQGAAGRKRRVVIEGGGRPRQDARQRPGERTEAKPKQTAQVVQPTGPVTVPSGVTVRDLSQALGVPAAQIIKIMMNLGAMVQITQTLTDDEVELIAAEVEREVIVKHADEEEPETEVFDDPEDLLEERPPVVTIMGHLDQAEAEPRRAARQGAARRRRRARAQVEPARRGVGPDHRVATRPGARPGG